MSQFTAIGLGEILWDVLPEGRKLGGAPANFAYHINQLGGVGIPVSRVGNDTLGREALDILQANDVSIDHISIDSVHPTGTVAAVVDEAGVATYTFPDDVAWDSLAMVEDDMTLAASADVICFGTLAQRASTSRKAIRDFLLHAPDALKVYDINLRQDFYTSDRIRNSLDMADVLKINDDELALIREMFDLPLGERRALDELIERHNLKLAVLTRGSEGALILSTDEVSDLPGVPTSVVDTIGAGDSFTAAMALAYLHGKSLDEINRYATRVAAYVCGQAGAMPKMPTEFRIS
jgi:fructokinase